MHNTGDYRQSCADLCLSKVFSGGIFITGKSQRAPRRPADGRGGLFLVILILEMADLLNRLE